MGSIDRASMSSPDRHAIIISIVLLLRVMPVRHSHDMQDL